MSSSLSIIVPSFNEEGNLKETVSGILNAIEKARISQYEIILIDDGSRDGTRLLAQGLAEKNPQIQVICHEVNRGFGAGFKSGFCASRYDYICCIPGDNEVVHESVYDIFCRVGRTEILIPYGAPQKVRPWMRRKLSTLWTCILNFAFGLKLRYYNGPCVYKRELLIALPMDTNSFGFMAANLIRTLKKGVSFEEIEIKRQKRAYGTPQVFRINNILSTLKTILQLFWEVHFK